MVRPDGLSRSSMIAWFNKRFANVFAAFCAIRAAWASVAVWMRSSNFCSTADAKDPMEIVGDSSNLMEILLMATPKQCVFSGVTDNLNTMTIKLDDNTKVEVYVSDDYLDSATPSAVKAAYIEFKEKQQQIDQERAALIAKAAELGLVLVDSSQDQKPQPPAQAQTQRHEAPPQVAPSSKYVPLNPSNRVIDGRTADNRVVGANAVGTVSALGESVAGAGSEYAITSMDKPSEDLKDGEVAEIGTVRGRLGADVAIPIRRVGKTGETKVRVIDTGGDLMLQRRFKEMAKQSDTEPPEYGTKGYRIRTVQCGLCRGNGVLPNKKSCPKCDGAGLIDI